MELFTDGGIAELKPNRANEPLVHYVGRSELWMVDVMCQKELDTKNHSLSFSI